MKALYGTERADGAEGWGHGTGGCCQFLGSERISPVSGTSGLPHCTFTKGNGVTVMFFSKVTGGSMEIG